MKQSKSEESGGSGPIIEPTFSGPAEAGTCNGVLKPSPSVGRIVLFHSPSGSEQGAKGQPFAAVITHVWGPQSVNLHVFEDQNFSGGGLYTKVEMAKEGDPPKGRTWFWPPRV